MVYNPVIQGWCIPSTGIQFPQGAGRRLSRKNQLTEYSCFRDDQASPQALIPVIPSVLVFLAERVGVEPTDAFTSPVFKAGAFDHSAISPFFSESRRNARLSFVG